ncbi:sideroflexin-1-like [Pomacea canaliculata]|uniref:sideroflexin-1-like n=1 Tax=Pomacea canaliculata TaxID=400727 RepID=UPI000D7265B8|nr:sideroflexin-1-like [Pomacea canaliculata]XP_025093877.1 sideroflexin-1-like [Pomacea canaliculata]XP_025093878.1 sideroflexin-1-like [Pomacea canaliculata]XP_025093879.1 sideroflexin-1-like [Pomacea canaliculata]XP_025093881.1 sideroflexin-1-like [Pomacea canaliculata]XP_025093882.1 sideroflexin-1-like [Pomacea canaliculata]XP_025093883.1 sideroflexin-1-like [Pomacea canaliculata]XP_025093884.1 sideroflexin-1-like [Pomacea canaliculata]
MSELALPGKVDIEQPRYDQTTYSGRAKHFFITTNPLNIFASSKQLEHAKAIVERYRAGENVPNLTVDELWRAKQLYDSAFHPDTKEKMFILGRMSAQVPMNMIITGCMMTFYKTTPAVVFWQWFNQSFNAVVNYTNRSGDSPIPLKQLGLSYVLATGGSITTALTLNSMVKKSPPLIGRFVPFVAVAAANCINIPCMRSRELTNGIPVFDENGNRVGTSSRAAASAITQVVVSRIVMAMPGMMIVPFIMNYLDRKPFLQRMPWLNAPIQTGIIGIFLVFATPLCCALFPQRSSMSVNHLEPELKEKLLALPTPVHNVYFNKGL